MPEDPKHIDHATDVGHELDELAQAAAGARERLSVLRQDVSELHAMLRGLTGELGVAAASVGDGTFCTDNKQEEKP